MTPIPQLIEAARKGDQAAYEELVAPHRTELHAHCYRMLGSTADAEDALQEALLRAWRGIGRFEGRSSLRTWLYRITTNACLKLLERRQDRILPIDYGPPADPHAETGMPLTESLWVDPYPTPEGGYEELETVELAFVAALQHLAPAPRAVLILRDVLGYSAAETAELLATTPTAVYSSLQRAHKAMSQRVTGPSQQIALRDLGDARVADLARRYADAWERSDVDAIVAMLTEDAVFSMPPQTEWFAGASVVGDFLAGRPLRPGQRWRLLPARANGQLAFGSYAWDSGDWVAHGLTLLTVRGQQISDIITYRVAALLPQFGLPSRL